MTVSFSRFTFSDDKLLYLKMMSNILVLEKILSFVIRFWQVVHKWYLNLTSLEKDTVFCHPILKFLKKDTVFFHPIWRHWKRYCLLSSDFDIIRKRYCLLPPNLTSLVRILSSHYKILGEKLTFEKFSNLTTRNHQSKKLKCFFGTKKISMYTLLIHWFK